MKLINQLAFIQKELNAPKGQNNDFGGYKYRSCEDILEAVKPLLGGCVLLLTDEVVAIGERVYVKATASIRSDGMPIEVYGWAREQETKKGMDQAQITGAASSYARKYALNGLFCIDDTKDPDTNENKEQVDNTPNWYNSLEKHTKYYLEQLSSGKMTNQDIVDKLKAKGFLISKETNSKIMELGK